MSEKVKAKVLKNMDKFVWENGEVYGPYRVGQVIELPKDLAEMLMKKGAIKLIETQESLPNIDRFLLASSNDIRIWLFITRTGAFITVLSENKKIRVPINIIESIRALKKLQEIISEVMS